MPTLQSLSQQAIPPPSLLSPSHPSLPTPIPQNNPIVVKQEVNENGTPSVNTTTTVTPVQVQEQAQGMMTIPDDHSVVRVKQEVEPLTVAVKVEEDIPLPLVAAPIIKNEEEEEEEEEETQIPMETPSGITSSNVEEANHTEPTKTEEATVESTSIPTGIPAVPSQDTVSLVVDVSLFNPHTHHV